MKDILVVGSNSTGRSGHFVVKELLKRQNNITQKENEFTITASYRTESKFVKMYGNDRDRLNELKLDLSNFDSYPQSLAKYDTIILFKK